MKASPVRSPARGRHERHVVPPDAGASDHAGAPASLAPLVELTSEGALLPDVGSTNGEERDATSVVRSRGAMVEQIRANPVDAQERLLSKLVVGEITECWGWHGFLNRDGYAEIFIGVVTLRAARLAHELWVGPIPDGLTIDHLCFNRACCNPAHLEAVPHKINSQRAKARQTHCKHGHEFTPENTAYARNGEGRVARRCRKCNSSRWRRLLAEAKSKGFVGASGVSSSLAYADLTPRRSSPRAELAADAPLQPVALNPASPSPMAGARSHSGAGATQVIDRHPGERLRRLSSRGGSEETV